MDSLFGIRHTGGRGRGDNEWWCLSEFLSNGLATTSLHIKKNWSVVLKLVGVKEEENKISMNEKWSFNLKKERAKSMI